MPSEEYHAHPAVSRSQLEDFARSPWYFQRMHRDPARPPRTESPSQLVGNLAHCATFEPGEFFARYTIGPDVNKNTKAWKEFVEQAGGKQVISQDQYYAAHAMAQSMRNVPSIKDLFASGSGEVSIFATDADTGLELRCRVDWLHKVDDRRVIVVDGKTMGGVTIDEMAAQIGRMKYHLQQAFYTRVMRQAGLEVLGFVFVGVETSWPYMANAAVLDDDTDTSARATVDKLLRQFAQCQATDKWPPIGEEMGLISIKPWFLE